MNTITIRSIVEGTPNVTYTEGEVLRYIEKAKAVDDLNEMLNKQVHAIRDVKNKVRDFFSEGEWNDGEQTINKGDVNDLLESIGCYKLTSRYGGTFTITGTFQVEAEDEDEAANKFVESVDVNFYDGDITIDDTTTDDVSEDY